MSERKEFISGTSFFPLGQFYLRPFNQSFSQSNDLICTINAQKCTINAQLMCVREFSNINDLHINMYSSIFGWTAFAHLTFIKKRAGAVPFQKVNFCPF